MCILNYYGLYVFLSAVKYIYFYVLTNTKTYKYFFILTVLFDISFINCNVIANYKYLNS